MRIQFTLALALIGWATLGWGQVDSLRVSQLFEAAVARGESYAMLRELVAVGPRLSGSAGYDRAADWAERTLQRVVAGVPGASVYRMPVQVPHWRRGPVGRDGRPRPRERVRVMGQAGVSAQDLAATALGGSVGTGGRSIIAPVVELFSLDTLAKLGTALQGKIVFFNRPMEDRLPMPFTAYGRAGDQRRRGAAEAAKYGAVAIVVRSLTQAHNDEPHTGNMSYDPEGKKIPAAALGRQSADRLSALVRQHPGLRLSIELSAEILPDVSQPNVIAEVRGSVYPNEVIVAGGHLDAWDNGEGAHDDGSGCVHAIEALRVLLASGWRPQRTLRVVLFANEENGLRGAQAYAAAAAEEATKGLRHVAAIESDAGGFAPRGFSVDGTAARLARLRTWSGHFAAWGAERFDAGGGGADITPLKPQGTLLIGLRPNPQTYFDYHHTAADRLEAVNPRELALGCGAVAGLLYLLDQYGAD